MKDRRRLTPGDAYHYRNKFEDAEAELIVTDRELKATKVELDLLKKYIPSEHLRMLAEYGDLKVQYGEQQGIIQKYVQSFEDMKTKYIAK